MDELRRFNKSRDDEINALPVRTGLRAGSLEVNCIVEAFEDCMELHNDSPLCSYAAMENCYFLNPA